MRHEKLVERERAVREVTAGQQGGTAPSSTSGTSGRSHLGASHGAGGFGLSGQQAVVEEVAALYQHHGDLSLKPGQTIRWGQCVVGYEGKPGISPWVTGTNHNKEQHQLVVRCCYITLAIRKPISGGARARTGPSLNKRQGKRKRG